MHSEIFQDPSLTIITKFRLALGPLGQPSSFVRLLCVDPLKERIKNIFNI